MLRLAEPGGLSAGDGYKVDPLELEEAATQLRELTEAVKNQAISKLDSDSSAFGHAELARAAAHFADKWQRGVSTLLEDAAEVANRLKVTAGSYSQREEDTVNGFESILRSLSEAPGNV